MTYTYTIIKNGDCGGTGMTWEHYHSASIADINEKAKNGIPSNAIVTSITAYVRAKTSVSTSQFKVTFCNSVDDENEGQVIFRGSISTSWKTYSGQITSFSSTYPFSINTNYASFRYLVNSQPVVKKYNCEFFKIDYEYYIPTYTITVNAGNGGSVTGGGTYNNQTVINLNAIPSSGYVFKQWQDGNTSNPRSITVTGNATYTAYFSPRKIYVGNKQPKVYVANSNVKSVYIGNEMIYQI